MVCVRVFLGSVNAIPLGLAKTVTAKHAQDSAISMDIVMAPTVFASATNHILAFLVMQLDKTVKILVTVLVMDSATFTKEHVLACWVIGVRIAPRKHAHHITNSLFVGMVFVMVHLASVCARQAGLVMVATSLPRVVQIIALQQARDCAMQLQERVSASLLMELNGEGITALISSVVLLALLVKEFV